MSHDVLSFYVMSWLVVSFRKLTCRLTSSRAMSYRIVSRRTPHSCPITIGVCDIVPCCVVFRKKARAKRLERRAIAEDVLLSAAAAHFNSAPSFEEEGEEVRDRDPTKAAGAASYLQSGRPG